MAESDATHTITKSWQVTTSLPPHMLVQLVDNANGTYGYRWQKRPFPNVWMYSDQHSSSRPEIEQAMQHFIDEQQRQHINVIVEGIHTKAPEKP